MKYTKVKPVKDIAGNRDEDVCFDFFVPNDWNNGKPYILRIGEQVNIPSGIKTLFNKDLGLIGLNKSGVATKRGCVFGAHVIDSGYRGEIHLDMMKVVRGSEDIKVCRKGILGLLGFKEWATVINAGDKILQFGLFKISNEPAIEISNAEYEKGPKTKRSTGGFGSTGTK